MIRGLEIAVLSMKKGEQSKFLISPAYNLGTTGCAPRVPKNTAVLMEVELVDYMNRAGEDEYYSMPMEERKSCDIDLVRTLLVTAKEECKTAFNVKDYRKAFHNTKRAIDILEGHRLKVCVRSDSRVCNRRSICLCEK